MPETLITPSRFYGTASSDSRAQSVRTRFWIGYVGLLTICFIVPLVKLASFATQSDLHSHIILIPVIVVYLFYFGRERAAVPTRAAFVPGVMFGAVGVAAVISASRLSATASANDYLSIITFAYVTFVWAGAFLWLGTKWVRSAAFPLSFLLIMVPLPDLVVDWMERMSVLGSAEVAASLLSATGVPVLRDGTIFALPTIVLEVAQECSGIRSSWVLFIASVLASHLFLSSPWRRIALVAFVIPLGIIRNGFRILVIGLLCVHVGPEMIDSPIHHRGGPIFFALSLVPLFFWLVVLRRGDTATKRGHRSVRVGGLITEQASARPH